MKNETLRMCIACRQMRDKRQLIRIVKNKEGEIFVDPTGKKGGRGAYICKEKVCLDKLKKQKILNKTFKCEIPETIYQNLEIECKEKK